MINPGRMIIPLLLIAVAASCGDPFAPILTPVPDPEEVVLHDFDLGSLLDPAAFDMFNRSAVRTDQSNAWDFVFSVDSGIGPTLQARESILGLESDAGLQTSNSEFGLLSTAPKDGYITNEPVPIAVGSVLTVRSRQTLSFRTRCRVYGKLEIISIEGTPATVTLRFVINPNCEQRDIEPEEE